jgi:hypothetical protein
MWSFLHIYVACQQMLEDVLVKLNPGLLRQKLHLTQRALFTRKMDL